jgi:hypothetical protein
VVRAAPASPTATTEIEATEEARFVLRFDQHDDRLDFTISSPSLIPMSLII